jgi:hypothetical protein
LKKPANTASFKTHIKKKSPEKKHERQKMKKFNNFFRCKKIRKTSFSKKAKYFDAVQEIKISKMKIVCCC